MVSDTIVPPPPKAYRRVYHMMEAHWALVAIEKQRLKVSRFADLNDPFELFALNRHSQAARKASKRFAADFNTTTGLLCFGADWSSVVMWSHYAEKHKGICLGLSGGSATILQPPGPSSGWCRSPSADARAVLNSDSADIDGCTVSEVTEMHIEHRCACNELLRIRQELVGRPVRCPSCKRISVWDDAPKKTVRVDAPRRNPLEDPKAVTAWILDKLKKKE